MTGPNDHNLTATGPAGRDALSQALSRRRFLALGSAAAATLAGCAAPQTTERFVNETAPVYRVPENRNAGLARTSPLYDSMYGPKLDEQFPLPAIPYYEIDPAFLRQEVADPTGERPGTIVVDTGQRFLYLVRENGRAMRYGVGIGREGFSWSGRAVVQWKQKWPKWTPPAEMIARQPELEPYSAENGGMAPGLDNPLGARALYIFQNGEDTLYRLHGSPEYKSIGKAVSSGCVRLINQDICDLYDRVPTRTPILVI
ncbi:lipoprotein-anchoring transpeptidase ErfK/SrfK [Hoeflea halophila]|uniref:Lipoprotein-anchoring transpeptidase ErfK/SrfK n=1 Tax=Hoeflea halophila TaxID=714899 RepID=A0A286ID58_9HYPH|nr:L,D-transpeptidase [Hoeflea halophila]SOE18055.1 lipoprotein-anchoring transpeptidase ErfK/SrfK [Hoeflea halophila]